MIYNNSPEQKKNLKILIVKLFIFLGPIGKLIPIIAFIPAFRLFYLVLPLGILTFFCTLKKESIAIKIVKYCIAIILYTMFSSFMAELNNNIAFFDANNPIFRAVLLDSLFFFIVLSFDEIKKCNETEKNKLIFLYLKAYLISMILGYIMFVGFYQGVLSLSELEPFHVLLQMGYGIMRFSPGSYPNEYGIVSSFSLSILTLLIIDKKELKLNNIEFIKSKKILIFTWMLTVVALFLTTTRAAYIAYIISLLYLCMKNNTAFIFLKRVGMFFIVAIMMLFVTQFYIYDVLEIIITSYTDFGDENASAYQRFIAWDLAKNQFFDHWIFGIGFGMANNIHNVYLQYLFESGLVGVVILFITVCILIFYIKKNTRNTGNKFLSKIRNVGIMHVMWFAMSNHNLNHHLTWFCVLIAFMTRKINK